MQNSPLNICIFMKYKYIYPLKDEIYFILSLLLCRLSNDYFNKFKTDCLLPTHKSFSFDSKLMIMIKAFHNSTTYDVGKPRYWKHKWLKRNVSFLNNSWCWPHFLCQYDISLESLFRLKWIDPFIFKSGAILIIPQFSVIQNILNCLWT